ncbi:MAG: diacylglycerol kinase [Treponema sp.]|jgi:diacylglycerol kinase family enzyme|nr:diacylglycerol kinase [Treponema sp.]
MKSTDNLAVFSAGVAKICAHTPLAKDKPLRWIIIANPKAGGFTIKSRWKKHAADLNAAIEKAALNPPRKDAAPSGATGVLPTGKAGDAKRFAETVIAAMEQDDAFHLIITAGGDGTSLEVLTALFYASESLRARCAVLRLPMGTGNDGADAWELGKALDLIVSPSTTTFAPALRLTCATTDKGTFLAFNVLSVGLDAFVTHNTNKMKGALPGDSYKLWVDIASLFYDRIYTVGHMDIKAFDEDGAEVRSLSGKPLLIAAGASGRRTYGSHKHILPDDRNVCVVWQMPVYRKLMLKEKFTTGAHIDEPETVLFSASRIEFQGEHPILAQMDGETALLTKEDFPCAIALTGPVIPILRPAPIDRGKMFS